LEADAKRLLDRLKQGAAPESVGDATLVQEGFRLVTQSDIARQFGEDFARQVTALAPGVWTGPLYSGLGGHLVKVTEHQEGRLPELAEVRSQVEREYMAQRRQKMKDIAYRRLREKYEVVVQPQSAVGGMPAKIMAVNRPVGTEQ
jgi:hypothetical protein